MTPKRKTTVATRNRKTIMSLRNPAILASVPPKPTLPVGVVFWARASAGSNMDAPKIAVYLERVFIGYVVRLIIQPLVCVTCMDIYYHVYPKMLGMLWIILARQVFVHQIDSKKFWKRNSMAPVATMINIPNTPHAMWRLPRDRASSLSAFMMNSTRPKINMTVAARNRKVIAGLMSVFKTTLIISASVLESGSALWASA